MSFVSTERRKNKM